MNRFLPFLLALLIADVAVASAMADTNAPLVGVTNALSDTNILGGQKIIFKGLINSRLTSTNKPYRSPSNDAVMQGLRWLVSSQNPEGSWGDNPEELEASTGLALLAFFGHGETPMSKEFGEPIKRGLKYLLSIQQMTNRTDHADQAMAISQAISTWALCEGYALTRIPHLKTPAEGRLAVILKGQRSSGLWDEAYQVDGGRDDMDASIWQVLALRSGWMAGIQLDRLQACIDKAMAGMEKNLASDLDIGTKAGLVFCMQVCGQGRKHIVRTAIADLSSLTPDWDAPSVGDPIFRWFLMTHALFQNGGKPWMTWSRQFTPMLVNHQVRQDGAGGKTVGYWESPGKNQRFGRVYSTALSLLMLEVYYQGNLLNRYPLYQHEQVPASTNDADIKIEF